MSTIWRARFTAIVVVASVLSGLSGPRALAALSFNTDSGWVNPQLSADFFSGAISQKPLETSLFNPGNTLLQLPENQGFLEGRANLNVQFPTLQSSLVLRPRARGSIQNAPPGNTGTTDQSLDLYFNEAYVSVQPTDIFQAVVGRQNFQWGPAESMNPSNIFFPGLLVTPAPFDEVRGKTIARGNFTFGSQWSWIFEGELPPLPDHHFQTTGIQAEPGTASATVQEVSYQRIATKLEFNWDNNAHWIGGVVGRRKEFDGERLIGGAYGAYTWNDAWQTYFDAQLADGMSVATTNPTNGTILITDAGKQDPQLLSVVGARYTFTGGTELRGEYIYNQAGYTAQEQNQIGAALSDPSTQRAMLYALSQAAPVLPGKYYVYAALRASSQSKVMKIFDQPTFSLRGLGSIQDGSTLVSSSVESGLSKQLSGYIYGGGAVGPDNSEMRRNLGYYAGAALKLSL